MFKHVQVWFNLLLNTIFGRGSGGVSGGVFDGVGGDTRSKYDQIVCNVNTRRGDICGACVRGKNTENKLRITESVSTEADSKTRSSRLGADQHGLPSKN